MIKGIFFGPSGVLYQREEHPHDYARRLLQELGYATVLSPEDETHLQNREDQATFGIITAQTYWDEFLRRHGVTIQAKREELASQIFKQVNRVFPVPGARDTIKALKARGFILGIISNSIYPHQWKMSWLAIAGVAEFIDVVAYSTDLCVDKSRPPLFWLALNKAGLTPRQAAYVSRRASELEEPRRIGMITVAALADPGVKADYYATSLPDLLSLPIFQRP